MKRLTFLALCITASIFSLQSQICDPTVPPSGLTSTYTPGSGALLEWDVVPGSVGVQIKVSSFSGGIVFTRRNIVFERDWFLVPEDRFTPGDYTWHVQAACSTVFPYSVTPLSSADTFNVADGSACPVTAIDIDGNVYNTVQIGDQCWMKENLKVERYRNGDSIATGLSNSAWNITFSGAFAVYNNDEDNKSTYGLLYNWYVVSDSRGFCPLGWHVPTDGEWTQMITVLDPAACGTCFGSSHSAIAGGLMKSTGTLSAGTGLWQDPNFAATNYSEFSGLPGGYRNYVGPFNQLGSVGYWWSSSSSSSFEAWSRRLEFNTGVAYRSNTFLPKNSGFSVRCIQD